MADPEIRTQIYSKKAEAFTKQQRLMRAWKGSDENQRIIQAFQEHLFAIGTGQYRVAKLTSYLRRLCDMLHANLQDATKADIQGAVARINQATEWGEHSKSDYRRTLKQFYRWYEDEDPRLWNGDDVRRHDALRLYKYLEKDVRGKPREESKEAAIITEKDIQKVLSTGCRRPIERALVAFLHETGCRVGELLNMRLQDVEMKGKHAMVRLDGKTGERRVPIVQSLPYLIRWLEDHPAKDNPRALLWMSTHNVHYGRPFRYLGVNILLRKAFQRANVAKKCNPHWFRHSRATLLSQDYSDVLRCKLMGWTIGSKQVRTYTKLAAVDVEEKFLQQHGLEARENPEERVRVCGCGTTNEGTARYCYRCGNPLNVAIMLEDEQKKQAAIEEAMGLLSRIMADPKLRERWEERVRDSQ